MAPGNFGIPNVMLRVFPGDILGQEKITQHRRTYTKGSKIKTLKSHRVVKMMPKIKTFCKEIQTPLASWTKYLVSAETQRYFEI